MRIKTHPGEILLEEFIKPYNLEIEKLAVDLKIDENELNDIIQEKKSITLDFAKKLAKQFKTSVKFWLNLQTNYDTSKKMFEENRFNEFLKNINLDFFIKKYRQKATTKKLPNIEEISFNLIKTEKKCFESINFDDETISSNNKVLIEKEEISDVSYAA